MHFDGYYLWFIWQKCVKRFDILILYFNALLYNDFSLLNMNPVQTLETPPQTADKLLKTNQQNIKQGLLMRIALNYTSHDAPGKHGLMPVRLSFANKLCSELLSGLLLIGEYLFLKLSWNGDRATMKFESTLFGSHLGFFPLLETAAHNASLCARLSYTLFSTYKQILSSLWSPGRYTC